MDKDDRATEGRGRADGDARDPASSGPAELLQDAAARAIRYASEVDERAVPPSPAALKRLSVLDESLPERGLDPAQTVALLDEVGSPGTVATTSARYFGFVNGGTLPVALGTAFLAAAWDQNAALPAMSPVSAAVHEVVARWLRDLLGLPERTEVALVTGATVANASALAVARDTLLLEQGWDVQGDGLFEAPRVPVVVGEHAHTTLHKSLGLVGLGRERVHVVPADDQGRIRADQLPLIDGPVLVCAQAGEVNTGAFDPFDALADWVAERQGWLHVDGAFGLWALADPTRADLVAGLRRADSWATDGHKWLNVTYDCGMVLVSRPGALMSTFAASASYLPAQEGFLAMHHTPQSSQRARQLEVWAVLRTLGREGVAHLVQQACDAARTIASRLGEAGYTVLNDVVLNQVLVRLEDPKTTEVLIAEIQADGRIWCGPTQWDGGTAMRISVSSWKTSVADARLAADVIIECGQRVRGDGGA